MPVGSWMAYVQRKLPASGVTVTDTGMIPAEAVPETARAATAAANMREIKVRRIILLLRERRHKFRLRLWAACRSPAPFPPSRAEDRRSTWGAFRSVRGGCQRQLFRPDFSAPFSNTIPAARHGPGAI